MYLPSPHVNLTHFTLFDKEFHVFLTYYMKIHHLMFALKSYWPYMKAKNTDTGRNCEQSGSTHPLFHHYAWFCRLWLYSPELDFFQTKESLHSQLSQVWKPLHAFDHLCHSFLSPGQCHVWVMTTRPAHSIEVLVAQQKHPPAAQSSPWLFSLLSS